jgi:hypothetical protein
MKKKMIFTLEKTEIDENGGVKFYTVANRIKSGFSCPDSDGLDLDRYIDALQNGEKIEVAFSFVMASRPNELASDDKEATKQ